MRKLWKLTTKDGEKYQGVGETLEEALPKSKTDFYGEAPLIESEEVDEVQQVLTLEERVTQLELLVGELQRGKR